MKGKTKGVGDERATAAALLFSGTRGWLRWLKIFARPDSSRVEYSLLLPPFPLCRFLFDMEKKKKRRNIMRRSDGQSFQPSIRPLSFALLYALLCSPFFPSFSTISGIALETRRLLSPRIFRPLSPCTRSCISFLSRVVPLKQIVPIASATSEGERKERRKERMDSDRIKCE